MLWKFLFWSNYLKKVTCIHQSRSKKFHHTRHNHHTLLSFDLNKAMERVNWAFCCSKRDFKNLFKSANSHWIKTRILKVDEWETKIFITVVGTPVWTKHSIFSELHYLIWSDRSLKCCLTLISLVQLDAYQNFKMQSLSISVCYASMGFLWTS